MAKIKYRDHKFRDATLDIIRRAAAIGQSYAAQGYSLTLRQLYYQFVARGWLANRDTEYKRLGVIIDDARYAGLIDWDHIVDRTRTYRRLPTWGSVNQPGEDSARDFVVNVLPQFRINKWESQPTRIEVWIEKDALIDVVRRPADLLNLGYFACRGYNSTSNAWDAAQRVGEYFDRGAENVVVLHLGDHDPSGIDMTRDIEDRFRTFLEGDGYDPYAFRIERLALNMDQVIQYNPPPNPTKMDDSRAAEYIRRFGDTSWELDALDPPTIDALINTAVLDLRDDALWAEAEEREAEGATLLKSATSRWGEIVDLLSA